MDIRLDIAPLLDIIFILLIFFAISTTLITNHKGIKLELPAAESITEEKKGIILTLDEKQQIFVDGTPLAAQDLRKYITDELNKNTKLQVFLNAHNATPYETIILLLDEIRLGGCYDIVLETKKKIAHAQNR